MNKLKIIYELVTILVASNKNLKLKEITTKLNNHFDETPGVKERRVKNYLKELQNDLNMPLDGKRGIDGGYKLSVDARNNLRGLIGLSLTDEEKNALNDSFEIAEKSLTFYYNDDLDKARDKLYAKTNLKDQDFEYYLGKRNEKKDVTEIIKQLKHAMMEKLKVMITSKHDYYTLDKGIAKFKPLFIIHDTDETFIVLKDVDNEYHYQNILNIFKVDVLQESFSLPYEEKISKHMTDFSLMIKGKYALSFKVTTPRGRSVMDLWNYEYETISEAGDNYKIVFHEEYKGHEFLLRMLPHIKNLRVSGKKKNQFVANWNNRLVKLHSIN